MCIRFNKIVYILLFGILISILSCTRNIDGERIFEGVYSSSSEGGQALRAKLWFDGLEEDELRKLTIKECRKYGKSLKDFSETPSSALDTAYYKYTCYYSDEDMKNLEKIKKERLEKENIAEENRKKEIIIKKDKKEEKYNNAKAECEAIGYKKGTEKFGECVLNLTE